MPVRAKTVRVPKPAGRCVGLIFLRPPGIKKIFQRDIAIVGNDAAIALGIDVNTGEIVVCLHLRLDLRIDRGGIVIRLFVRLVEQKEFNICVVVEQMGLDEKVVEHGIDKV